MIEKNYDVKEWNSKALAAQIVVYRALKLNKQLSIDCMAELFLREKNGDKFDYNSYIEEELAKMPERPKKQDVSGIFGGIMEGIKGLKDTVNSRNGKDKRRNY